MNAVAWIELRSGFDLRPWQRAAVLAMFPEDGSTSQYETFLLSTVKKAGKTSINAWMVLYAAAVAFPDGETAYVIANDADQAEENTFSLILQAVRVAGLEASGAAVIKRDRVLFPESGTRIITLPADYAGSAGARFGITSFTELWAYRHESHIRLWEELTPNPNRRSLRIVDSYAGFDGDAPALEPLWERALAGQRVDDDMPIFTNGRLWAFIDQGEEAQERGWLGDPGEMDAYYDEQRASLRPGTYNRLHLNQWQSSEEAFITAEQWDACVVAERPKNVRGKVFVGLDAATKKDCTAVVAVTPEGDDIRLVAHKIWAPRRGRPVDLEDVESYVLQLTKAYDVVTVEFDPYQMERSKDILRQARVPMNQLTQATTNLTAAGQTLYDLVAQRRLVLYADRELRQHALNAVATQSGRGWKLSKEKSSKKIDATVALSFACLAAIRDPKPGRASSGPSPWSAGFTRRTPERYAGRPLEQPSAANRQRSEEASVQRARARAGQQQRLQKRITEASGPELLDMVRRRKRKRRA